MTKKSKWNNDEDTKEERAMWLMIKERKDYYLWIMRMTKKKQEQRRCVQKEDRSERWGEERTYKMEQSAMWQGADGARKKRFTLWLLAVSSSLLHIHWQHIHTHHCHCLSLSCWYHFSFFGGGGVAFCLLPTAAGSECVFIRQCQADTRKQSLLYWKTIL